jgi:signal transduction histidine kinase/ActR/RegA family two-component response regulator
LVTPSASPRVPHALRWLFAPPVFESEELTQRAQMFHRVTGWTMVIATALLATIALGNSSLIPRALVACGVIDGLGLILLVVNRRGYPVQASVALVGGLITLITIFAFTAGGVRSPGISMYFVFVLMAATLLGERAATITAIVCVILGFMFVALEITGHLPASRITYGPSALWILSAIYMSVVILLTRYSSDAVRNALARAERELADRRTAQANLSQSLRELGERVKELRLLHKSSQLFRDSPVKEETFQELVDMMPRAWQYHEVCEARIVFRDIDVSTPGFRESEWRLSVPLRTSEGEGSIDVVYLDDRPAADVGPFLVEERDLLILLRDAMVAWIEREGAERRRVATEQQLRQSQKMEALGTLAGGIAHDFNNILTAMIGNAQLGAMDADQPDAARAAFGEVLQSAERASDLVRRILLFSRRQDIARQTIAFQPVVQEVLKLVQVSMPKSIAIRTEYEPDLPEVSGDPSQLYQVVMNLCTNAIHAMSPAGGTLTVIVEAVTIDAADKSVAVELPPGQYVRLTVRDTGVGMSRQVQDRLFEPFFTTKGHAGTGLGLSVVHGIVRDHDGAVTVATDPGRGSAFAVYLPTARAMQQRGEGTASAPPRGDGQHIMYVDDEEALVAVVSRILTRQGYRCTAFSDPTEALRAFRMAPHSFDAVITDVAMPVMTGLQLAEFIHTIRPDIPIAVASGHLTDPQALTKARISAAVLKPVSIDTLARTVADMLTSTRPSERMAS